MLAAPPPDPSIPAALRMRREPKQQRTLEVARKIEQATLDLLAEQGFFALNTNAIAERAGVGIKSLYHLYPNKEAIICRLATAWLQAVRAAQQELREQDLDWPQTLAVFDQALDTLDESFSGHGPLWQAMDLIPALQQLEAAHEREQIAFWSERLRHFGCRWPDADLVALVMYFYRTADVAKQCAKENGAAGPRMWQLHRNWLQQLLGAAITEAEPARILHTLMPSGH
ncbi:TetR/AcrR family transcriptional regulator [Craterilacuibacter sp.]|uniref:TetR/AcrR family transcriptional regulator n=1 Tax=Craterilacuibacter sp. TaxID=2870909 RepID=UPI003F3F031E